MNKTYWICLWLAVCAAEIMMVSSRLGDIHRDLQRLVSVAIERPVSH